MLDLAILALATWRVAHMLSREEGPLGLFERLRERASEDTTLGRGIRCPLCVGVWASFALLAVSFAGTVGWLVVYALAIAGAQAALQIWLDNQETTINL